MEQYKYTNRLINETSPYLLHHAHNPVDWYPWCDEAFQKARDEDKPVLLSIGYSACHWCHVMERESFENEEIADFMNRHFISVKVDREEMPDVDEIYQYSIQILGRGGGWPLTAFLTPDRKPFFGGTYYPPVERYGQQAFPDVLAAVSNAYRERKWALNNTIEELNGVLKRITEKRPEGAEWDITAVLTVVSAILREYDPSHGGFGSAPKFPSAIQLSLLLRYYKLSNDSMALEAVENTLHHMAEGGMYDQLGGGFHRYSVDDRWQIPHFEKMLYDNAIISRVYLDAYRITKNVFYRRIAEETLSYLLRDMQCSDGGFYASEDADSEGGEGKFYVWSRGEISEAIGKNSEIVMRYFGVTDEGNFDGDNILHVDRGFAALVHEFEKTDEELQNIIAEGKEKLFAKRCGRDRPFKDVKIITSWNGLTISAFVDAYMATGRDLYLKAAEKAADFILNKLWSPEGRLRHVWMDGAAKVDGNLDDYAFLASSLIDMFEVTFNKRYLRVAEEMTDSMMDIFRDNEHGGFYNTGPDPERIFFRLKTGTDQSIPSGNGVAAMNLHRLSLYRNRGDYKDMAGETARLYYSEAKTSPFNYASILSSAILDLSGATEITVVGDMEGGCVKKMLTRIGQAYVPGMVMYFIDDAMEEAMDVPEFAKGKHRKNGKSAVYICKDFKCSEAVTEPDDLERLL